MGLSPAEVAAAKEVSVQAVYGAISRGYLTLLRERPKILDPESVEAWEPDRRRQENARARCGIQSTESTRIGA